METKRSSLDLFLILLLLALAVLLVDDRWLRAGLTIVPALLLTQRANALAPAPVESAATPVADGEVHGHAEEALRQTRELYTTCHLLASGGVTPETARERATVIERNLNLLLAKLSGAAKT